MPSLAKPCSWQMRKRIYWIMGTSIYFYLNQPWIPSWECPYYPEPRTGVVPLRPLFHFYLGLLFIKLIMNDNTAQGKLALKWTIKTFNSLMETFIYVYLNQP